MDAIISSAVEEICLEGAAGVALPRLWTLLLPSASASDLPLCDGVKRTAWNRLLALPGLRFEAGGGPVSPNDPKISLPAAAEKIGVKVIAEEHIRDSCLGIQELKAGGKKFPDVQRRILERIALSRGNGLTQDQLGKELGLHGKEIFYYLKGLESNGVIMRQSTIVKKGISVVNTNSLFLTRYVGKRLNSNPHMRVEIMRGEATDAFENVDEEPSVAGDEVEEDVSMRDYLPAMEAVCNMLEQSSGKVLVVSDIKRELGYRKTKGHRLWRNILNRLKHAKLVEEFQAKVNVDKQRNGRDRKPNICLRLLKKFNAKAFQPKNATFGYDNSISENYVHHENRKGQDSELVMELPLDHQIYDTIEREGSNGIFVTEVYRRLGINGKKTYPRILDMRSRFKMPMTAECSNRTKVYRIWTFGNNPCDGHRTNIANCNEKQNSNNEIYAENELNSCSRYLSSLDVSNAKDGMERHSGNSECVKTSGIIPQLDSSSGQICDVDSSNISLPERSSSALTTSSKIQPFQRHPCLDLSNVTLQRKERIISRLERDKFVLLAELQRWLDNLEIEKSSKMDRKTLLRIVDALEKNGLCKHIEFKFPSLTNHSSDRQISILFHPSFVASIPENLGHIYKKFRDFEYDTRAKGLAKSDGNNESMAQIINIERPSGIAQGHRPSSGGDMRSNGYIKAKMIRAKLLHNFFWSFLSNLHNWKDGLTNGLHGYDSENPHSLLKLFDLDRVTKAMPVELFLQVVGFAGRNDDLIDHCQRGLKISDLHIHEYKCLMDINASARLSSLVDILVRLKLIQLVTEESAADAGVLSHVIVCHALELKPYIEKPCSRLCSDGSAINNITNLRHYFDFLEKVNVDDYWMALENYYVEADPNIATGTFPGVAVQEGFASRSWSSVRVMSAQQRVELLKHLARTDPSEKLSTKECRAIADELNLTLEQVLNASYDRRQSHFRQFSCYPKPRQQEELERSNKQRSRLKRSRSSKYDSQMVIDSRESIEPQASGIDKENSCRQNSNAPVFEPAEFETDNEENHAFINRCVIPEPTKRRKFTWNDDLDRQLVIQYARYRAARKAELHRVPWASLSNLPANSHTCRRRMAQLKGLTSVRYAIMKLCNILGERYLRYRDEIQEQDGSSRVSGNSLLVDGSDGVLSMPTESEAERNLQLRFWDDFDDPSIKVAVDEVLRCKNFDKQGNSIENGSGLKRKSFGDSYVTGLAQNHVLSPNVCEGKFNSSRKLHEDSGMSFECGRRRLGAHRIPRRVLNFLSNKSIGTAKQVTESLSVANAVELLKLVFLSTSAQSDVQALFVETLRQYSESDIYAAFNYLREKSFMVVGSGSRPFVLSQKFLNNATSSPFPIDSGRKASKFSAWLHKQGHDDIELNLDLECGEIFHLFALISSRMLNISACLPDDGVGEVEDSVLDSDEKPCSVDEIKKNDFLWKKDSDFCLRREKGFPGIRVVLDRIDYSDCEAVDFLTRKDCLPLSDKKPVNVALLFDDMALSLSNAFISESLWTTIASYAEELSLRTFIEKMDPISSDLIKLAYSEIKQADEQGLEVVELSEKLAMQGNLVAQIIADTLETYQLVIKVNAFNCVRLVDASLKSKYYISTLKKCKKDYMQHRSVKSQLTNQDCHKVGQPCQENQTIHNDETELNVSESHQVECGNLNSEGYRHMDVQTMEGSSCNFWPILPWIDVCSSRNSILYKGLVRRVLGIVMQNPGILEEDIIRNMDVLNPQSCRQLLELMILDKHIFVRKMLQTTSTPPTILHGLLKFTSSKPEPLFREHFFANPMRTQYL